MALRSKDIAQKYNCEVFQQIGIDNNKKYWVALGMQNNPAFNYADGWTLEELVKNIEIEIDRKRGKE